MKTGQVLYAIIGLVIIAIFSYVTFTLDRTAWWWVLAIVLLGVFNKTLNSNSE